MQAVLSYVYSGGAQVAEEDLTSFLAVAEDLKIEGLIKRFENVETEDILDMDVEAKVKIMIDDRENNTLAKKKRKYGGKDITEKESEKPSCTDEECRLQDPGDCLSNVETSDSTLKTNKEQLTPEEVDPTFHIVEVSKDVPFEESTSTKGCQFKRNMQHKKKRKTTTESSTLIHKQEIKRRTSILGPTEPIKTNVLESNLNIDNTFQDTLLSNANKNAHFADEEIQITYLDTEADTGCGSNASEVLSHNNEEEDIPEVSPQKEITIGKGRNNTTNGIQRMTIKDSGEISTNLETQDKPTTLKECPICQVKSAYNSFIIAHMTTKRERQCPDCKLYFGCCQSVVNHKKGRCKRVMKRPA